MALYDYECKTHGVMEQEWSIEAAPAHVLCPTCDEVARRKISPILTIFKGEGWGSSK